MHNLGVKNEQEVISKGVEYSYGNPIDFLLLKRNVQRNYPQQVEFWKSKAKLLYSLSLPQEICVLCGSKDYKIAGNIHGWPWHQCNNCTHAFNGRYLPPEKVLEFYKITDEPINYSDTYTDPEVQDYRRDYVSEAKVNYITRYCSNKNRTWLDVAAGNGDVLYLAKNRGYEVSGIEINPDSVRFAKERYGVDLYLGKIEDYDKEVGKKWDIISFLGISDIIENPVEYMQIAVRLLNRDGIMVMSFPNFDSLSTRVQFAYPDQIICRHLYPSVVGSYTEKSATMALEREGFKVIAAWYYGMDFYELLNNLSFSDERFKKSELCQFLRKMTNDLQHVFDAKKSSDEFMVISKKK